MVSRRLLVLAVALMMDFTAPAAAEGFVEDRRLFNHRQLFNERRGLFMKKLKKTGKKVFGGGAKKPKLPVKPPKLPVKPPKLPVKPPKLPVKPPKLPVEPPKLPVEPPKLPVEPPTLPVEPPKLPVEPPKLPVEPPKLPVKPAPKLNTSIPIPQEPNKLRGRRCCKAVSLDCVTCNKGITPAEFCAKFPKNRFCFEPFCSPKASYCKALASMYNDANEQSKTDNDEKITSNPMKAFALEENSESLTDENNSDDAQVNSESLTDENNSDDAQSKILIIASAGTATVVIASVLIALAIRRKMTGSKTEVKNPVQSPEKIENHPVKEKTSPITKYFDKTSGRWYEHNSETKATRWLTPEPVEQTV